MKAWLVFLFIAVVLLPFGRKRLRCDHHTPSVWNALRRSCGCMSDCDGRCVTTPEALDRCMDEIAWSVYILDLCMWSYLFFAVVYVVTLFIWSIILWTAVIVITVCLLIAALCMACGAACGEGAGGSCDCGACCGDGATMGCGDCCCPMASLHTGAGDGVAGDAMFYWSGPVPYDPFWGAGGYGGYSGPSGGNDDCCAGCCTSLCRPIAVMLYFFPAMPENMWGGLIGSWMGTRTNTAPDRAYQGGNSVVDFFGMGWRRRGDLHGETEWRRQVHDFLTSSGEWADVTASGNRPYSEVDQHLESTGSRARQQRIGGNTVTYINRPFTIEEDSCVQSSFDDYENDACWICQTPTRGLQGQQGDEWDMWLSCHHLFCKNCSTQMLNRRMPCPLCRVASTTVLRGLCSPVPVNPGHGYNAEGDNPNMGLAAQETPSNQSNNNSSTPLVTGQA